MYVGGKFAKYEQVGTTLYFDVNALAINVLYKGIYLDESGLPRLNEKRKYCYSNVLCLRKSGKKNIMLQWISKYFKRCKYYKYND